MRAWIDQHNRAMVEVHIANHVKSTRHIINAWIDTAFDGHLVMPNSEVVRLELSVLADTEAVLADGSKTRLRCYYCVVDWLGQAIPIQVVANNGNLPLIGTGLLSETDLRINYRTGVCTLT
jgi:clan AA aspartic protease